MPIKKIIGVILLAHAVYVAFNLISNLDSLRQTSEAYAAPGDPFWIFWGFLGLNCLIVLAAVILGVISCELNYLSSGIHCLFR